MTLSQIGRDWKSFQQEIFTTEEIIQSNKRVDQIIRLIELKQYETILIYDIPSTFKYKVQSNINIGDYLYLINGEFYLCKLAPFYSYDNDILLDGIKLFRVLEIQYKNWFCKIFKSFLKTPIQYIKVQLLR